MIGGHPEEQNRVTSTSEAAHRRSHFGGNCNADMIATTLWFGPAAIVFGALSGKRHSTNFFKEHCKGGPVNILQIGVSKPAPNTIKNATSVKPDKLAVQNHGFQQWTPPYHRSAVHLGVWHSIQLTEVEGYLLVITAGTARLPPLGGSLQYSSARAFVSQLPASGQFRTMPLT